MLMFFIRRRNRLDMCTNVFVFLQEEKETVDICTNVVFLQEEKQTVDICTNVIYFFRRRKIL